MCAIQGLRASLLATTSVLALAAPSWASTWIVDASGGGHFADIPPALAAAVPGDVLLVLPGSYSGFTLDKRVHVLGQGAGVQVQAWVTIQNLTAGSACAVTDLNLASGASILACSIPIVLDGLTTGDTVFVTGCTDVRFVRSHIVGMTFPFPWSEVGHDALRVESARVELCDSSASGGRGSGYVWCDCCPNGLDGGLAVGAVQTSELHIYRSSATGGDGGDAHFDCYCQGCPGSGGTGLGAADAASFLIAGEATHVVSGGSCGSDSSCCYWTTCSGKADGLALWSVNTAARYSGATIQKLGGSGHFEQAQPADPSLSTLAPAVPGQVTTFRVHAAPGSSVELALGRAATVIPVAGLLEDQLLLPNRWFKLGAVPATGFLDFQFLVPASLPEGFVFFAQARVTFSTSDARFTNSVPLVLR
ncbi:MAG: hypothetical protein HZA52_20270 [Planctomycetes bacterium]|nr:hypothetical protein [Planctomycetota bacterium]